MTTQQYTIQEYADKPFSETIAYTLDHRKLVLEIKVTPDPERPPYVVVTDKFGKCCWMLHYEKTTASIDYMKAYHYERICIDAHEEYTYWLRLIVVDTTALVPRPEQFPDPDYIAERRQHWTIVPRLEQVREISAEPVENK